MQLETSKGVYLIPIKTSGMECQVYLVILTCRVEHTVSVTTQRLVYRKEDLGSPKPTISCQGFQTDLLALNIIWKDLDCFMCGPFLGFPLTDNKFCERMALVCFAHSCVPDSQKGPFT